MPSTKGCSVVWKEVDFILKFVEFVLIAIGTFMVLEGGGGASSPKVSGGGYFGLGRIGGDLDFGGVGGGNYGAIIRWTVTNFTTFIVIVAVMVLVYIFGEPIKTDPVYFIIGGVSFILASVWMIIDDYSFDNAVMGLQIVVGILFIIHAILKFFKVAK